MTDTSRPILLAVGIPGRLLQSLDSQAGLLETRDSLEGVTPSDWDLLIVHGDYPRERLLQFRRTLHFFLSGTSANNDPDELPVGRMQETQKRTFVDSLSLVESPIIHLEKTNNLLFDALLRSWKLRQGNGVHLLLCYSARVCRPFAPVSSYSGFTGSSEPRQPLITPLVTVSQEHEVHAYRYKSEHSDLIRLPDSMLELVGDWASVFIDTIREEDPIAFPAPADWRTDVTWSPVALESATNAMQLLKEKRATAEAEFNRAQKALEQALERELIAAESGAQRLLSEQGEELQEAVMSALVDLGFEVRDMDDHHDQKTGAKLEDLRVTDPSQPDWICLAEVKGYSKGAKSGDIAQIVGRPLVAYALEHQDEPSAVWHIVNPEKNNNPSTRKVAIPNEAVDLSALTDASGCLIDTRDLFQAWKAVEAGRTSKEKVRESLRAGLTRWTYKNE